MKTMLYTQASNMFEMLKDKWLDKWFVKYYMECAILLLKNFILLKKYYISQTGRLILRGAFRHNI